MTRKPLPRILLATLVLLPCSAMGRLPLVEASVDSPPPVPARVEREGRRHLPPHYPAGYCQVETRTLPRLLEAQGFVPPEQFKALVVVVDRKSRRGAPRYRCYDYYGSGNHREDWWPASSIKVFAAVAALEQANAWGFSPAAKVEFHDRSRNRVTTLADLVEKALIPSDNLAYDRLIEIVGFDELNRRFFPTHGFHRSVFLRSYSGRKIDRETGLGTLRDSPAITLTEGQRVRQVRARRGVGDYPCPYQGNCTTLLELADVIRRIVHHDLLPRPQRLRVSPAQLELLRASLAAERPRGLGVVNGLRAGFPRGDELEIHHKPGFANDWFSDAAHVRAPDGREWLVAMAGFPGRDALDRPARHIGALLDALARDTTHPALHEVTPAPSKAPRKPRRR